MVDNKSTQPSKAPAGQDQDKDAVRQARIVKRKEERRAQRRSERAELKRAERAQARAAEQK